MKTLITLTTLVLLNSCTPVLAKDQGKLGTYSGSSTFPNYQSPKTDWNDSTGKRNCTPIATWETNVFTKETRQVIKCY